MPAQDMRPFLIAYTLKRQPEWDEKYRVTYSAPNMFSSPDLKYDYFYTHSEVIAKEYQKFSKIERIERPSESKPVEATVENVQEPTEATLPVDEDNSSQEPTEAQEEAVEQTNSIPDNYEDLPWGELRALALKHTDDKSVTKAKALEILAEAKGA